MLRFRGATRADMVPTCLIGCCVWGGKVSAAVRVSCDIRASRKIRTPFQGTIATARKMRSRKLHFLLPEFAEDQQKIHPK